mmetsp:Transcript_1246/g.2668  ORF Transcript_1246/g.2668 Transcript_1246/m.2668 type:complete len:492 (+) Transcript_1246:113-1588(+)
MHPRRLRRMAFLGLSQPGLFNLEMPGALVPLFLGFPHLDLVRKVLRVHEEGPPGVARDGVHVPVVGEHPPAPFQGLPAPRRLRGYLGNRRGLPRGGVDAQNRARAVRDPVDAPVIGEHPAGPLSEPGELAVERRRLPRPGVDAQDPPGVERDAVDRPVGGHDAAAPLAPRVALGQLPPELLGRGPELGVHRQHRMGVEGHAPDALVVRVEHPAAELAGPEACELPVGLPALGFGVDAQHAVRLKRDAVQAAVLVDRRPAPLAPAHEDRVPKRGANLGRRVDLQDPGAVEGHAVDLPVLPHGAPAPAVVHVAVHVVERAQLPKGRGRVRLRVDAEHLAGVGWDPVDVAVGGAEAAAAPFELAPEAAGAHDLHVLVPAAADVDDGPFQVLGRGQASPLVLGLDPDDPLADLGPSPQELPAGPQDLDPCVRAQGRPEGLLQVDRHLEVATFLGLREQGHYQTQVDVFAIIAPLLLIFYVVSALAVFHDGNYSGP